MIPLNIDPSAETRKKNTPQTSMKSAPLTGFGEEEDLLPSHADAMKKEGWPSPLDRYACEEEKQSEAERDIAEQKRKLTETMVVVNVHLAKIFCKPKDRHELNAQWEKKFALFSDQDGTLRLKFKSGEIKSLQEVLPKFTRRDIKSRLACYGNSLAILGSGGVIAGILGTATVEEFLIARGLSTVVPWLVPVTALVTIGGAIIKAIDTAQIREFAPHFNKALNLYEEALGEADRDIREHLFAQALQALTNGGFTVDSNSRLERNSEMPSILLDCIEILIAKIRFAQLKPGSYKLLQKIKNRTSDPIIKGICLAGQIDILTTPSLDMTEEELQGYRDFVQNKWKLKEAQKLDKPHVISWLLRGVTAEFCIKHKDLLSFYFENVHIAYADVYEVITKSSEFSRPEDIESAKIKLNNIIKFKELNTLRYLDKAGIYAELAFRFVQGLSHIAYVQLLNPSEQKEIRLNKTEAKIKMESCKESIRILRPDNEQDRALLRVMSEYIDDYLGCEQKIETAQRKNKMSMLRQYEIAQTNVIDAARIIAINAFRDDPDASDGEIEAMAKLTAAKLRG